MAQDVGPWTLALGEEIRKTRRASFLTQQQLADRLNEAQPGLGLDRASISRWEKARRRPSLANVRLLIDVLGISEEIGMRAVNEPFSKAAA